MQTNRIIQVEEKVPPRLLVPLSIQHMFAMFGASVLVPFMFGINPAIVLFMNGVGTLLFIFITKGKAPAYLGSSFAFIAPATIVIQNWGYQYALGGFVVVGLCGCILAAIIYKCGTKWIDRCASACGDGPGRGADRSGACRFGCLHGQDCRRRRNDRNCCHLLRDACRCGAGQRAVPQVFVSYPDPDCDYLRLCGRTHHRVSFG